MKEKARCNEEKNELKTSLGFTMAKHEEVHHSEHTLRHDEERKQQKMTRGFTTAKKPSPRRRMAG